ncbi:DALR anticodon-binding domain-containing protein 3-like isoform X1 [Anneissia japonica]|uniref:DALR anticodon-binding domain-containing protein 3-like isoform X1 n=1 Tax=Anneissia japonica TaxID=1529436 RepID=UPI00142585CC|nr:DALR anticodon-binding domain-containing protein 3-like isoform X1 [Anneissia japonica]
MAAPMKDVLLKFCCTENYGIMNILMKNVQNCFMLSSPNKSWVQKHCNKSFVRRNQSRNNHLGQDSTTKCDIYIPYGVLRAAGFDLDIGLGLPASQHDSDLKIAPSNDREYQANIQLRSMMSNIQEESQKWVLPVSSCYISASGSLNISICRQHAFKKVLQNVKDEGSCYGCKNFNGIQEVVLNYAAGVCHDDASALTLTQLRALLICNHLEVMLKSLRRSVHRVKQPTAKETSWIDTAFSFSIPEENKQNLEKFDKRLKDSLAESKFRVPIKETIEGGVSTEDVELRNSDISLEVKDFVTEQKQVGKNYIKNIKIISVNEMGTELTLLQELSMIESVVDSLKPADDIVVLHVTSHDKEYKQQCLDILFRIGSQHANRCQHLHLVHGQVHTENMGPPGSKMQMTAEKFYNLRKLQMRKASEVKHGDTVKGKLWDARINNLTSASVKFELLGTSHQQTIKLDLGQQVDGERSQSKDGVFVMYNYARLSTLFKKFEERVNQGFYPSLPNISEVDFNLLREEEEWHLFFQYILPYPDIITEVLEPVFHSVGPRIQLQTHKVCGFLVNLSRDLSAYYSRTHVLSEARAHLLPVMFARLHLLKAIKQIMDNSLKLIDIEPLQEM